MIKLMTITLTQIRAHTIVANGKVVPKFYPQKETTAVWIPPEKYSLEKYKIDEVCYRDPNDPSRIGRPIILEERYQKLVDEYMKIRPVKPNKKFKIRPQLVTGFSANHYREHEMLIDTAFEHFPDQKILVYDLGLIETQVHYRDILNWQTTYFNNCQKIVTVFYFYVV